VFLLFPTLSFHAGCLGNRSVESPWLIDEPLQAADNGKPLQAAALLCYTTGNKLP
jgi:hypothetical protein